MDVPAEIFLDWGIQRMESFYVRLQEVAFKNQLKGLWSTSTTTTTTNFGIGSTYSQPNAIYPYPYSSTYQQNQWQQWQLQQKYMAQQQAIMQQAAVNQQLQQVVNQNSTFGSSSSYSIKPATSSSSTFSSSFSNLAKIFNGK